MAINSVGAGTIAYKAAESKPAKKNEAKQLSRAAQNYLKELKANYKNMDFTIADYETQEEAQEYLSKGSKEFSVLIEPEILEKMATDAKERKKYEDILKNAGGQFEQAKKELGEDAEKVKSFGISIDKNGAISYFATLFDSAKIVKKDKAEKTDKKDKAEKTDKADKKDKAEKPDKLLQAGSMKELIEMIKQLGKERDSGPAMAEKEKMLGQSFDMKM